MASFFVFGLLHAALAIEYIRDMLPPRAYSGERCAASHQGASPWGGGAGGVGVGVRWGWWVGGGRGGGESSLCVPLRLLRLLGKRGWRKAALNHAGSQGWPDVRPTWRCAYLSCPCCWALLSLCTFNLPQPVRPWLAAAKKLVLTFGSTALAVVLALVVSYVAASPTFGWTGGRAGALQQGSSGVYSRAGTAEAPQWCLRRLFLLPAMSCVPWWRVLTSSREVSLAQGLPCRVGSRLSRPATCS